MELLHSRVLLRNKKIQTTNRCKWMNLIMLRQGSQTQKTAKPHLIYKTFQKNIKLKEVERDLLPETRDQMRGLMTE